MNFPLPIGGSSAGGLVSFPCSTASAKEKARAEARRARVRKDVRMVISDLPLMDLGAPPTNTRRRQCHHGGIRSKGGSGCRDAVKRFLRAQEDLPVGNGRRRIRGLSQLVDGQGLELLRVRDKDDRVAGPGRDVK